MGGVRRTAVIDMGSNSFRLVVYGYEPGRYWQHVDEIREAVRVGQGMGEQGVLQPEPMERAVRTANVYGSFCRSARIDEVMPVATSAIRSARNGRELLARIKEESGLDARVLDEREEARYGYLAIANSTTVEDGFGIDIGGGSVQAMRIAGRQMTESGSWQLGAVRVSEAFLPDDDSASPKQVKALRKHVKSELARVGKDYADRDLGIVAISSNDVVHYPDDHPDRLKEMAQELRFLFPVCYDETQDVAKAFSAACTPDFFLFDKQRKLSYRGQMDDSRPGNGIPVTGRDLRTAIDALLAGQPVPQDQRPSIGCNIKWKPGNAPQHFRQTGAS